MGEGINKARTSLGAFTELSGISKIEKGCSANHESLQDFGKKDGEL